MAQRVGIVGGGLAGLAAGCALSDAGFHVTLHERRPYIGGRASSYEHPGTGEVVDNCQHVLLGCCTNLLDLYDRFHARDKISWYDRLTFVEPGGRQSVISPSMLPAPLHTAPSFLAASSLSLGDKLAISRVMLALMFKLPEDTSEDFLSWLKRHGQTERAIERFWKVVLVSALNEELHLTSVHYAAQVFRESFLKSAEAGKMGIPKVPLSELYSLGAEYIRQRGGDVLLRSSVESFEVNADSVRVNTSAGESEYDFVVLAVPYMNLPKLLPLQHSGALAEDAGKMKSSPITGIHLWFDRQFTDLDHAVLLDRTIQWMFHKSKLLSKQANNGDIPQSGSYIELVVSASKSLVEMSKGDVIELAMRELAEFFPAVRQAKLLKSAVIKEVHATYSAHPLSDANRPSTQTEWPRVFMAGDWTRTGWPATMEGAVRSGYMAAEAVSKATGESKKFLIADLPPGGLMLLLG